MPPPPEYLYSDGFWKSSVEGKSYHILRIVAEYGGFDAVKKCALRALRYRCFDFYCISGVRAEALCRASLWRPVRDEVEEARLEEGRGHRHEKTLLRLREDSVAYIL